jgi:MmyB-like transcription regulator ligand binding domain
VYGRPGGRSPVIDAEVCSMMIATLRANYANHIDDPLWTALIEALCAANPEFARLWAEHPIIDPMPPTTKSFECFGLGTVRVRATGFPIQQALDTRMVVYLPETAADAALITELRARHARRLRPA